MRYPRFLLLVLFVAACQGDTDVSQNTPSHSSTAVGTMTPNPGTMSPQTDEPSSQPTPAPRTQEVHLIEYQIHMPQTLPAGRLAFRVENGGKEDHAFEIEGNGIEEKTQILTRGNSAALEVDLKPGTYTVYCPVADHDEKGMKLQVRVQ